MTDLARLVDGEPLDPTVVCECGGRWSPEDPIRTNESGQWAHGACLDDIDTTPTHPVCTACWLTHPEGACDRG